MSFFLIKWLFSSPAMPSTALLGRLKICIPNDYSKNLGNPQDNLKSAFTLPLAGKDLASRVWKKVSPMNVGRAAHACLATRYGVSQKDHVTYYLHRYFPPIFYQNLFHALLSCPWGCLTLKFRIYVQHYY